MSQLRRKVQQLRLVDSLPEGPVKEALKARLDQVTTSEVTRQRCG
ncbi:hypothetical protein [Streptococcus agalactiae]|nr:hypothetical protein [Streptococcus agalactiae]